MKKIFITIAIFAFAWSISAQSPAKYWVQFKDKADSPYSIERPEEFLSPRAIEKRHRFNIEITEQDLPVNERYIKELLSIDTSMVLLTKSKWLNGVTVYSTEKDIAQRIKKLSFVAMCDCTAKLSDEEDFSYPQSSYTPPTNVKQVIADNAIGGDQAYGATTMQVGMNQAHWLHRLGAHGEGMLMVVMDVGFENTNKLSYFEALRDEGRLLGTRNFVFPGRSVFISGSHGTEVLSCITGFKENEFVGTAPKASFYLAKTEDSRSENKIEEDNWVAGLEWADSLGCDVLNSSLGYYKFDNAAQSYQYEEMNGKISRATQAASIAASKGIIVCISAGNEGDGNWHYITCPADAENVITVGAIDIEGEMAEFSSYGPTADGRVKPDAVAVGSRVKVVTPADKVQSSYGTSFSSPVLSGMVACLWQLFPNEKPETIISAVQNSGSNSSRPTAQAGYGVTNFLKAYNTLARNYDAEVLVFLDQATENTSCNGIFYTKTKASQFTIEVRVDGHPDVLTRVISTKGKMIENGWRANKFKLKLPKLYSNEEYGIARVSILCTDGTKYEQVVGIYR